MGELIYVDIIASWAITHVFTKQLQNLMLLFGGHLGQPAHSVFTTQQAQQALIGAVSRAVHLLVVEGRLVDNAEEPG